MKPKQKSVLLWLVIIVLIFATTPLFGALYEKILGRELFSHWWGPSNPEYLDGFFMAYAFFITSALTVFGSRRKYKHIMVALGILFLIDIFLGAWEGLIINLGVVIVAWLLAQGVLLVKKQVH